MKTFYGYTITPEGEIFSNKTGERKYTWLNKGRCALYERVQFWIEGRKRNFYVHRLVAQLYLPGWDPEFFVNHIDGDTLNNSVANLELGSQSFNLHEHYWMKEYRLKNSRCIFKIGTVNAFVSRKREI